MKKLVLILLLLLPTLILAKSKRPTVNPRMSVRGSSYSLEYTFSSSLPKEEVMNILFQYDHIKHYGSKTNLDISLVSSETISNRMKYHYDYKVAKLDLIMNRTANFTSGLITFNMSNYKRSNRLIPNVLRSGGTYSVKSVGGRTVVTYKQQSTLSKKIGWIYSKLIKSESKQFIEEVMIYMQKQERVYASAKR